MAGARPNVDTDLAGFGQEGGVVALDERRARKLLAAELQMSDKGAPFPTAANVTIILRRDPALSGLLGYNEFTGRYLLLKAPPPPDDTAIQLPGPYPRSIRREDIGMIQAYVQRAWLPRVSREVIGETVVAVAALQRFHPVRDWLASLRWDGVQRLDTWAVHAFGAPDDDYHAAVAAKFLIAAVRRVRLPGCKFDYMLMLEGRQNIGKSTALRLLFGDEWFSDSMTARLESKEAKMALRGAWCMEFAEIDQVIRSEPETVKAFISSQVDRYRAPYAPDEIDVPRQGVLAGTTNTDDYLRDPTGNRRFWPVLCAYVERDWIVSNRDQLWAEAAAREAAGEAIWLDDTHTLLAAQEQQQAREDTDVWAERIQGFLLGRRSVTVPDILSDCLSVPVHQQEKRMEMRVAKILRRAGWAKVTARDGVVTRKVWKFPHESETTTTSGYGGNGR